MRNIQATLWDSILTFILLLRINDYERTHFGNKQEMVGTFAGTDCKLAGKDVIISTRENGRCFMTALRQSAIRELEKLLEDKISLVLQILQGVNGLYNDNQSEREEAFERLEKLRKKGTVADYDAELASYRELKYGK